MKKRLCALLLSMVMLIGMFPAQALAESVPDTDTVENLVDHQPLVDGEIKSELEADTSSQVIFHANNGTDEVRSQDIFGEGFLMSPSFICEGHIFKGWATSEESNVVVYRDGDTITLEQDIDLYAVWAPTYKLSFVLEPNDTNFRLFSDSERQHLLTPDVGNEFAYTLENGTYYWSAERIGYEAASGEVTLTGSAQTVNVVLTSIKEDDAQDTNIQEEENILGGSEGRAKEPAQIGDVYQIDSAEELIWLAQEVNAGRGAKYNAVLTEDIDLGNEAWTPIGKAYGTRYSGIFDGQGFTVSGLNITETSNGNYGLFGYVEDGTVRNLTVEGTVNISGNGSASYGVSGIVGQFNGTAGAIENCVNNVEVNGSQNVGGIVGYLSGGYRSANKIVRNCANLAEITSNSNNAGGVIGYINGQVTLENCYNVGGVSGGGWRTGGITAYLNSGYATIRNGYTTGSVTGKDAKPAIGKKESGTIENVYYLSDTGSDGSATAKTAAEMKSDDFVAQLGGAFQKDMSQPINGGYPILTFQDTTPKYEVVIIATPKDAKVRLQDAENKLVMPITAVDGKNIYRVPDGVYTYSVSAFGYITKQGTVKVDHAAQSEAIELTQAKHREVTFRVSPSEAQAKITVTYDKEDRIIAAEPDGSYRLPDGSYHYLVKAKGYAKQEGQFTVDSNESGVQTVDIALQASTQWDGESLEEVTPNEEGVYEISNGAELAWFAAQVNSGKGKSYDAALTADIDLGGNLWTPIGANINYNTKKYAGTFDGREHVISGLRITAANNYVGLFGYVEGDKKKHAQIKNLTIEGAVSSSAGFLGGIVGLAEYTDIINCHNRATISHTGTSGDYIGGVVGCIGNNSSTGSVVNCSNTGRVGGDHAAKIGGVVGYNSGASVSASFNQGAVSGKQNVGGVIGHASGSVVGGDHAAKIGGVVGYNSGASVSASFNQGAVSGKQNVGGVIGHASGSVSNIYNTGEVTGQSGNVGGVIAYVATDVINVYGTGMVTNGNAVYGKVSSYSGEVSNSFYLSELPQDVEATAKTSDELKNLVDVLNNGAEPAVWKSVLAINNGYPVLSWQKDQGGSGNTGIHLNNVTGFAWLKDAYGLDTGVATWNAVPNADSYTVILWDYWSHDTETGTENGISPVRTVSGVKTTSFDFTKDIEGNGPSWYYFTVTPIAAEGSGYVSGNLPKWDNDTQSGDVYDHLDMQNDVCYRYTARLDMPTGLMWTGPMARWNFVDEAMGYLVTVYRLDEKGTAHYAAGGFVSGQVNALDCSNYFAVGGRYVFSVTALSEEYLRTGIEDKNSQESKRSDDLMNGGADHGIHTVDSIPEPDPGEVDRTDWIAISSAQQWMELANIEDTPSADDPQTSQQTVKWSKKYYLTADLDFSNLSAVDQVRTKSIGNATHRFTGIMDGNGHKITGLTLSNYDSGLFSYIGASGQVYDLTIEGANVQFSDNAAVLALNNYGTIRDCLVVNCNITADTGAVLGGLISRNYGAVRDCAVQGGTLKSNSVTATGHAGFVGSNETGGLIERCWTSMRVDTQSDYAGGFVGLGYGGVIRNCFSLGNVSARSYSGGFVGRSVYQGNIYQNCYAAGVVTVTESGTGHGFIGGNKPGSSFQYDQSEGIENCYYNAASPKDPNGAQGRTLTEMQSDTFLVQLSGSSGVWVQAADQNDGFPYLAGTFVPEVLPTKPITVQIGIAVYDKTDYTFRPMGEDISVKVESSGNTRLVDIMDAAAAQGLLTYSYETTPAFGRYIHTINGYAVDAPDGWMFTINDKLSGVSASLASVKEGDKVLWFEGTTENRFLPPTWSDLDGTDTQWIDINSAEDLLKLAESSDASVLAKNYRLTADLDLKDQAFSGIGTASMPFTGLFDGQGHIVSNVTIGGAKNTGFFGAVKGATIKNLTLKNATVSGTENVGTLVGWAQVELDKDDMSEGKANLIGNCHVTGNTSGTESVGGLVGLNDGASDPDTLFSIFSSVDKCTANVVVSITGDGSKIGGLVGENKGVLTKSAALGDVTAPDARMVGGLAGSSNGDIYDSHAEGNVIGESHVGGFSGTASGRVRNSYCLGSVSGRDYTGGFSGSLTQADTVISAGQVQIISGGTSGYHGGLAGELNGTLTGVDNQITIKNAYGNCTGKDGKALSVIGNTTKYQGESQKAILESMTLLSQAATSQKLYEMFGVNLPVSGKLQAEADKYARTVTARQESGSEISLLKEGTVADSSITANYEVQSPYLDGGSVLTLAKPNDTAATMTVPVKVTLTETSSGDVYSLNTNVILPVGQKAAQTLMDDIAAGYINSSDGWTVMDMSVYNTLPGKTLETSEQALQNAINLLITEAAGSKVTVSDRARIEIILRAIGIDSTKLYAANSSTTFSNAQKLKGMDLTSSGYYAAPYLLLSDLQGNLQLTQQQIDSLITLLHENMGNGLFGYEWDGVTHPDPDTSGAALAALARFYDTNADAKEIVDRILKALPEAMNEKGSLGSANSDAMVILGLMAVGKNPNDFTSSTGASVVDGILSYVNTKTNRFQFNGVDNALATEQGFRALVALTKANGKPYNIYDFSGNSVQPGRATSSGQVTPPEEPETDKTITVTFALKTDTETWIPDTQITVKKGSTVYHVFTDALRKQGDMSAVGAATGYVKSITKGDITLGEFDKGPNSGWLYQVNGELPTVGLTDCMVHNRDSVLFYYTSDWKDDPQAGSIQGGDAPTKDQKAADAVSKLINKIGNVTLDSGNLIQEARKAYDALTQEQKKLVKNYDILKEAERQYSILIIGIPFEDITGHWARDAIDYVYRNGLMSGMGEGIFAPNQKLDRAMLVAILYRLDGAPAVNNSCPYTDVAPDSWYEDAVLWATENHIVSGYGNKRFGPNDRITREQLASILFRYASYKAYDISMRADLSNYIDADQISAWALDALRWANAVSLITGRTSDSIAPRGEASRGEAAMILMRFCEYMQK